MEKNSAGRYKLPDQLKRGRLVKAYFLPEEYYELVELAAISGLSMSDILRKGFNLVKNQMHYDY